MYFSLLWLTSEIGWPETTEFYYPIVLEARHLKSKCQQGWFSLEALRTVPHRLPLLASGSCWQSFVHILVLSPSVSMLPSLCVYSVSYKDAVIGFRAQCNLIFILTIITSANTLSSHKFIF